MSTVPDAALGQGQPHPLPESPDVYRTLLESTKAIPWKIDWATMRFAYIGPQIETLLGWTQDSWQTVDDWVTRMHPEDRDYVVNFCVSQSQAGVDHEADYRAMTRDGGYVWIRDVVHVVRHENGEVDCLIGFMFDISERKRAEDELLRLHRELEQLSLTDGLTGIANRRMFDQRLETEWADARRSGKPVSLVVLDIDHFKQFNDAHGHVAGDECLRRVAEALRDVVQRPRDVVARFGGEEFILLLPETDAAAARELAAQCVERLTALRIVHGGQGAGDYVTASLGVGTVQVAGACTARAFVEAVDGRLYAAKRGGRNRVEVL
ncbi:sensor domain-containing diguanylate cyclase [Stenotrophomonas panacihumi]|uniref:sensor domain-containing diguanylate cyclase n=1 Tax=Stenotrophomonas panacihumi TaxID=676599 RepID=UPI0009D751F2|nr:sensor domain-containing diguanylate cyclase [Stenotrophomonas panacihumi]PTN56360.1 PAS domain S-box protein [Stenotrophomonas panacihumi]